MKKNLIYKSLTLACCSVLLSACTVPRMHMADQDDFTPSLNMDEKTQKAALIPITADLIIKQRKKKATEQQKIAQNYQPPEDFTASKQGYEYTIGYQDVLNIIVWDYDSLTNPATNMMNMDNLKSSGFTVDANGQIFYPYVGYVQVQGLTVAEARNKIAKQLSQYLKDPQLTLQIIQYNSQRINIMGAVRQPTMVPVTNVPTTVLDAVNAAGGPIRCGHALSSASTSLGRGADQICGDIKNIVVEQHGVKTTVDLDVMQAPDGTSTNWVLDKGSKVFIPPNDDLFYVLGDVQNPGAFNMIKGDMTLKQSIMAARGVTAGSAPAYTYVVRDYESNPRVYSINLRSPDALILAGQFKLQPEDVVFVSPSTLENVGQVLGYVAPLTSMAISTASLGVSIAAVNNR